MKLKTSFLLGGILALMISCTDTTTNESDNVDNDTTLNAEVQGLEDSTQLIEERMESSDKKIDTLGNQIDSLLKDI